MKAGVRQRWICAVLVVICIPGTVLQAFTFPVVLESSRFVSHNGLDSVSDVNSEISATAPFWKAIGSATLTGDAQRIFHGRGRLYPGCEHLTLDLYPPVWFLTSYNEDVSDDFLDQMCRTIQAHLSGDAEFPQVVYQCRHNTTHVTTRLVTGTLPPDPHIVSENGLRFQVEWPRNKSNNKHVGLFLDMATGRDWVRHNAAGGAHVLNLFAFTCSLSVAALAGGAASVVNLDMSSGALKRGQRNHQLNEELLCDKSSAARFLSHNLFKTWGKLRKLGPFDVVLVDPPSFQKGSFEARKDYVKVLRKLDEQLVAPDGKVLLCLNAPELDSNWLQKQVATEAPNLKFVERLEPPASFASEDPERGLKLLVFCQQTATTTGDAVVDESDR